MQQQNISNNEEIEKEFTEISINFTKTKETTVQSIRPLFFRITSFIFPKTAEAIYALYAPIFFGFVPNVFAGAIGFLGLQKLLSDLTKQSSEQIAPTLGAISGQPVKPVVEINKRFLHKTFLIVFCLQSIKERVGLSKFFNKEIGLPGFRFFYTVKPFSWIIKPIFKYLIKPIAKLVYFLFIKKPMQLLIYDPMRRTVFSSISKQEYEFLQSKNSIYDVSTTLKNIETLNKVLSKKNYMTSANSSAQTELTNKIEEIKTYLEKVQNILNGAGKQETAIKIKNIISSFPNELIQNYSTKQYLISLNRFYKNLSLLTNNQTAVTIINDAISDARWEKNIDLGYLVNSKLKTWSGKEKSIAWKKAEIRNSLKYNTKAALAVLFENSVKIPNDLKDLFYQPDIMTDYIEQYTNKDQTKNKMNNILQKLNNLYNIQNILTIHKESIKNILRHPELKITRKVRNFIKDILKNGINNFNENYFKSEKDILSAYNLLVYITRTIKLPEDKNNKLYLYNLPEQNNKLNFNICPFLACETSNLLNSKTKEEKFNELSKNETLPCDQLKDAYKSQYEKIKEYNTKELDKEEALRERLCKEPETIQLDKQETQNREYFLKQLCGFIEIEEIKKFIGEKHVNEFENQRCEENVDLNNDTAKLLDETAKKLKGNIFSYSFRITRDWFSNLFGGYYKTQNAKLQAYIDFTVKQQELNLLELKNRFNQESDGSNTKAGINKGQNNNDQFNQLQTIKRQSIH